VLVLGLGEFGPKPRVTENDVLMRRDHWPQAMGALVSGGSRGMGQVVGATSGRGESPREQPLTPQDLRATTYRPPERRADHGVGPARRGRHRALISPRQKER